MKYTTSASFIAAIFIAASPLGCADPDPTPVCEATPEVGGPWTAGPSGAMVDSTGHDASLPLSLRLEPGRRLLSISAAIAPASGHRAIPERQPWFSVAAASTAPDGPVDTVGTALQESPTVAAYESPHDLTLDLAAAAWSPDTEHAYSARFVGEGGAASEPGMVLSGWTCAYVEGP